jgi:hypothetical protein
MSTLRRRLCTRIEDNKVNDSKVNDGKVNDSKVKALLYRSKYPISKYINDYITEHSDMIDCIRIDGIYGALLINVMSIDINTHIMYATVYKLPDNNIVSFIHCGSILDNLQVVCIDNTNTNLLTIQAMIKLVNGYRRIIKKRSHVIVEDGEHIISRFIPQETFNNYEFILTAIRTHIFYKELTMDEFTSIKNKIMPLKIE